MKILGALIASTLIALFSTNLKSVQEKASSKLVNILLILFILESITAIAVYAGELQPLFETTQDSYQVRNIKSDGSYSNWLWQLTYR